jgi:hypothetical protein
VESLGNESTWFSALHRLTKLHSLKRQPEGVQVVEGVGLVASSFQFFSCLGSEFAEEVGDLFCDPIRQLILRPTTFLTICINIRLIVLGRFSTRLTI